MEASCTLHVVIPCLPRAIKTIPISCLKEVLKIWLNVWVPFLWCVDFLAGMGSIVNIPEGSWIDHVVTLVFFVPSKPSGIPSRGKMDGYPGEFCLGTQAGSFASGRSGGNPKDAS